MEHDVTSRWRSLFHTGIARECSLRPNGGASLVEPNVRAVDDLELLAPAAPRLLLRPGESDRLSSVRRRDRESSGAAVPPALKKTSAFPKSGSATVVSRSCCSSSKPGEVQMMGFK